MWGLERNSDTVGERESELKKYGGAHTHTQACAHIPKNPLSGYGRLHSLIAVAGEMCNGWCYQLKMSNGSFKYVWALTHTREHESTEEDGEGENEKMRRQGGRISDGEIWRMTLKTQAKNRTAGGRGSGLSEAYNLNVIKGLSVETMMMDS